MLFNQIQFIFIFLPFSLSGYLILKKLFGTKIYHIFWLVLASLFFYGYWNIIFLPILFCSIVFNYIFGLMISLFPVRFYIRKYILAIGLISNISALAFFKYTNFLILSANNVIHTARVQIPIDLPLGISFFTFTQIAYLVDIYKTHPPERNLLKYILFVSYFPHLIAGPIFHHAEMMPQFSDPNTGRFSSDQTATGLTLFAIGLFKMTVIADFFALIVNPVFKQASVGGITQLDAWGGALAYSLQIYFDFSGYCDMAIGLSLLFGIVLPFNFDAPYKSRSISEFWRRWHITLSRFLRDYLYIPLGGNRHGDVRRYINLLITMILGGLWHGAGWTFIIWGALHGGFLTVNHIWDRLFGQMSFFQRISKTAFYAISALLLTQICVVLAWVFFRADNLTVAQSILSAMAGFHDKIPKTYIPSVTTTHLAFIIAGYLTCFTLPNVNEIFKNWKVGFDTYVNLPNWSGFHLTWRPNAFWAIATCVLFFLGICATLIAGDGSQFLYFQF